MWQAWKGSHYCPDRILLLAESCYEWEDNGERFRPQQDHPITLVTEAMQAAGHTSNATMLKLTQAVCGCANPSPEQAGRYWNEYAFTNYVPECVGFGAGVRPSRAAWRQAADEWPALLELLKPLKIVVLGKDMWARMPDCDIFQSYEVQGYRLQSGQVAMCIAVKHPSRGPAWSEYARIIQKARSA